MATTSFDTAVAADMMADAIDLGAEKTGLGGREEAIEALRQGDCSVCEYVRHGLARGLAEYLGSIDATVRAVYSYDPEDATAVDGATPAPGINLIVWVTRKSAALASAVSLVAGALAEEHDLFVCPRADALCRAIDVQMVDDAQVRGRTGYGALIGSLYVRPLEVWRRQD